MKRFIVDKSGITFLLTDSKKVDGYGYSLARFFGGRICALNIGIQFKPKLGYWHTWYDWQHHCLELGFLWIYWSGEPLIDM